MIEEEVEKENKYLLEEVETLKKTEDILQERLHRKQVTNQTSSTSRGDISETPF